MVDLHISINKIYMGYGGLTSSGMLALIILSVKPGLWGKGWQIMKTLLALVTTRSGGKGSAAAADSLARPLLPFLLVMVRSQVESTLFDYRGWRI